MSPIAKIKKGILDNDMQQVIEGFELLTGEEIRPKETTVGDLELLEEETTAKEVVKRPIRSKDLDFSTAPREDLESKYGKREPIVVGKNQFVDDGTEDTNVKTPDVGRTTRRPPVKMVEVQCHVCNGKEMINAQYKSGEFHRCGKCVGV
jgi:hypothetical protein